MSFDNEVLKAVWRKGKVIPDYDPNVWRWDSYGSVMKYAEYGNRQSKHGWEVDHINPRGSDNLSNLQPLQWENNVRKSDGTFG